MNMKIAGSGKINSGEYQDIKISGSGHLSGFVRCASLHVSGSVRGEELECRNELKVSGSGAFGRNVKAKQFAVSGSVSCGGNLLVDHQVRCSGSFHCSGNVKCGTLLVSGKATIQGDVEAENVCVDGQVDCRGLINAEEIEIKFSRGMDIGSIGGSKIVIYKKDYIDSREKTSERLPIFSMFVKKSSFGTMVHVKDSIEGDTIALEFVTAQRVSGRIVAVSDGCEIDLIQYSEQIEVSPNAKVGKIEKV